MQLVTNYINVARERETLIKKATSFFLLCTMRKKTVFPPDFSLYCANYERDKRNENGSMNRMSSCFPASSTCRSEAFLLFYRQQLDYAKMNRLATNIACKMPFSDTAIGSYVVSPLNQGCFAT